MQQAIFWTTEEVAARANKLYAEDIRLPPVGYANASRMRRQYRQNGRNRR
jgi:hypothetical protein